MAEPLTERELEVMQTFWDSGEGTAADARNCLAEAGIDLSYPTVANLVRTLADKGYVTAVNERRPFRYRAVRSREEVSRGLLGRLLDRVFAGSREQLLMRLMEQTPLDAGERSALERIVKEHGE